MFWKKKNEQLRERIKELELINDSLSQKEETDATNPEDLIVQNKLLQKEIYRLSERIKELEKINNIKSSDSESLVLDCIEIVTKNCPCNHNNFTLEVFSKQKDGYCPVCEYIKLRDFMGATEPFVEIIETLTKNSLDIPSEITVPITWLQKTYDIKKMYDL